MDELQKFISNLTDIELAKFIGYRIKGFMGSSQQFILDEARSRGLGFEEIKTLFKNEIPQGSNMLYCCPQCGSDKYFTETDYAQRQVRYISYEVAIESNRCRICGFNPNKNDHKGVINKIKKVLGFYRSTRLRPPEIDRRLFS
ncbi:hypothetical protein [Carboxylicivirga marina]|uniref:Uncharacterized protein n=1 Tax=Carboxylicivirga marina TaxID=2800988 RepID=A0ABS1HQ16_9BACT|nr:hypothetical protein [Carboxylicivirga marina]MBK3519768.1 hypothetical protein [Carboxylicivirga marina]